MECDRDVVVSRVAKLGTAAFKKMVSGLKQKFPKLGKKIDALVGRIKKKKGLVKNGFGKISGKEYTVSKNGLRELENYLRSQGFLDDYENKAMLSRLKKALKNGDKITGADAVYYLHELKEAQLVKAGIPQIKAHKMAIDYYGVSPFSVYHPEVIKMQPEWWNDEWFKFWNIER